MWCVMYVVLQARVCDDSFRVSVCWIHEDMKVGKIFKKTQLYVSFQMNTKDVQQTGGYFKTVTLFERTHLSPLIKIYKYLR